MRAFNPGLLQCFNCQKYGHLAVSCIREVPTCRYCVGPHTSKDCKGKTDITLKCSNCKGPHATTSMNCQARKNAPGSMVQIVTQTKPVMEETQEACKEDRRDIRTSSTGLSRQYQCCRGPQTQAIRSEHPIYVTQETSGIGLSTAAEGSSTTEGRTVQRLYMGKREETGQTARCRGTGTSYNHSVTSGSLESVGRHQTRESSADSSSDQDDRGSSRCNQITGVMHSDRHDLRIVSWNAQGANMETARIQAAVQQHSIDVLMLQDTRYTERQDSLPPLRLRGYHTYYQPYVSHGNGDVECHGLLTIVSDKVPSECAQQQLRIGDGTESLSVRVWLNNKSISLHNIYRVDGEFVVVTPLSDDEESIMAGDFNARHTSWCRANNAAGSSLNDQLVQLDTHILMNTPHVFYNCT